MNYDNNNIFAKIIRKDLPSEVVYEDQDTLVIMDIMPRADGHILVIPKSACRNILDANQEQLKSCICIVQKMAKVVKEAFNADGVTVQQFNESAGGQEVFHLHFHVLPRIDDLNLRKHDGKMEDHSVLKANAEKIRAILK